MTANNINRKKTDLIKKGLITFTDSFVLGIPNIPKTITPCNSLHNKFYFGLILIIILLNCPELPKRKYHGQEQFGGL